MTRDTFAFAPPAHPGPGADRAHGAIVYRTTPPRLAAAPPAPRAVPAPSLRS